MGLGKGSLVTKFGQEDNKSENIRGYIRELDKCEKRPERKERPERGWSPKLYTIVMGKKVTAVRVPPKLFNVDLAFSLNRYFA